MYQRFIQIIYKEAPLPFSSVLRAGPAEFQTAHHHPVQKPLLPCLLPFLFSYSFNGMLPLLYHLHGHSLILFQNKLRFLGELHHCILIVRQRQIFIQHQVVHNLLQLIHRHLCQFRIMRIFIHPVLPDFRRIRPMHSIYYLICPISIPLTESQHTSYPPYSKIHSAGSYLCRHGRVVSS